MGVRHCFCGILRGHVPFETHAHNCMVFTHPLQYHLWQGLSFSALGSENSEFQFCFLHHLLGDIPLLTYVHACALLTPRSGHESRNVSCFAWDCLHTYTHAHCPQTQDHLPPPLVLPPGGRVPDLRYVLHEGHTPRNTRGRRITRSSQTRTPTKTSTSLV